LCPAAFDLADRAARSALRPGEAVAFDGTTQTLARLEIAYQILRSLFCGLVSGSARIVGFWWACYLLAGVVANFAALQRPGTLDALRVYAGSETMP
jgi:hypothetical protein